MIRASNATGLPAAHNGCLRPTSRRDAFDAFDGECFPTPIVLASSMFDVSSRAKLSVSALAERKIASARPRKYGLLLRAEEEMLLYGQALARAAGQALLGEPLWRPTSPKGYPDDEASWIDGMGRRLDVANNFAERVSSRTDPQEVIETVLGSSVSPEVMQAVGRAETRQQALVLLFMSAEFQRR